MATLSDRVFDNGLSVLSDEADKILITSQEATTYAEANATYALGNSTSLAIASPLIVVLVVVKLLLSAISDGSVTGDGTATHYAVVDTVNSRLIATGSLTTTQVVATGNTFSLGSFTVGIPDPS
jgi:hypothetical protein